MNSIKIKNIAELKARKGTPESNVEVLGYYTEGDEGGGSFYWDNTSTETDNTGTILSVSTVGTGRWKRIFSGKVSVKWFGAKGDNSTDDTVAIQKTLDFSTIQNSISDSIVYLPEGKYVVGDLIFGENNIGVENNAPSGIIGDGIRSSILIAKSGTGTVIKGINTSIRIFEGFWINCNNNANIGVNFDWLLASAPSLRTKFTNIRIDNYK